MRLSHFSFLLLLHPSNCCTVAQTQQGTKRKGRREGSPTSSRPLVRITHFSDMCARKRGRRADWTPFLHIILFSSSAEEFCLRSLWLTLWNAGSSEFFWALWKREGEKRVNWATNKPICRRVSVFAAKNSTTSSFPPGGFKRGTPEINPGKKKWVKRGKRSTSSLRGEQQSLLSSWIISTLSWPRGNERDVSMIRRPCV